MISLLQLLTCFLFATACISLVLQLVFVCFYHTILGFWGTRRVSGTRRIRGQGQILTRNGVRGGFRLSCRVSGPGPRALDLSRTQLVAIFSGTGFVSADPTASF
jgi:hypothetical protein